VHAKALSHVLDAEIFDLFWSFFSSYIFSLSFPLSPVVEIFLVIAPKDRISIDKSLGLEEGLVLSSELIALLLRQKPSNPFPFVFFSPPPRGSPRPKCGLIFYREFELAFEGIGSFSSLFTLYFPQLLQDFSSLIFPGAHSSFFRGALSFSFFLCFGMSLRDRPSAPSSYES